LVYQKRADMYGDLPHPYPLLLHLWKQITSSAAVTENTNRRVLYGIVLQHADDGYSRRGNFGSLLVHNMFLTYSPDSTNVFGSRRMEFVWGTSYSLVQTVLPSTTPLSFDAPAQGNPREYPHMPNISGN